MTGKLDTGTYFDVLDDFGIDPYTHVNPVEELAFNQIIKVEGNVLDAVDQLKDGLVDRLYIVEKKIDIHLTEYNEKKIFIEYRLNGHEQLIKHKFDRLANWIKQIGSYLHKQSGFQIRDDEY